MFERGGVYRVVHEALGGLLAKFSVSGHRSGLGYYADVATPGIVANRRGRFPAR
jgi:hypothetical protein